MDKVVIKKGEGYFRCSYDNELTMLIIAGLIVFPIMLVVMYFFVFVADMERAGYVPIVFGGIIYGFIARVVTSGRMCEYQTTDDAMIVTCGKKREYFYYAEVIDVTFEERKRLSGKHSGYNITVLTNVKEKKYRLIFEDNRLFTSIQDTPFHLLMENCGMAKREKPDIDPFELLEQTWGEHIAEHYREELAEKPNDLHL